MMVLFGILILLGAGADIAIHGYTGLHALLIACGLLLVLINVLVGKLFPKMGGMIGKGIMSLAVLALAVLFLAGLFSAETLTDVNDEKTMIARAEKILEKENAEKAAAWLEKESSNLTEFSRNIKYELGSLYAEAGNNQEAKRRYEEILNQNGYDLDARYNYAILWYEEKNYSTAIDTLRYIIKLQPDYADAYMTLGDCYWGLDDNLRGIYYYKLAVDGQPDSIEKRVKLAQAYANIHSWEEADAEYKKALEMASGFDEEMMVYNGYTKTQQADQADGAVSGSGVQ